jgi:hypothetical protein
MRSRRRRRQRGDFDQPHRRAGGVDNHSDRWRTTDRRRRVPLAAALRRGRRSWQRPHRDGPDRQPARLERGGREHLLTDERVMPHHFAPRRSRRPWGHPHLERPSGWSSQVEQVSVGGRNDITGISCPAVSLCVAVDRTANAITSTSPTGGAGAWNVANIDQAPYSPGLTGVSCPATSLCVATVSDLSGGNVLTSTNPTGGPGGACQAR